MNLNFMNFLYISIFLISGYFFLIFIVLRILVPFMGFSRLKLPKEIPNAIREKIEELETKSGNSYEYLREAYTYITSNWHAGRFTTVLYAHLAFRKNLEKINSTPGFAQCNTQNYLLFVLLAGSKYFKESDIRVRTVFFNMFIHQYLEVRVEGKTLSVDPAGASIRGMPLGKYISFFG